ncbi:MAG TPA: hypothetical protein VFJ82_04160 [Longimicrobium sp.]|nr:hypothetical protein [Longimicrobium sp.]
MQFRSSRRPSAPRLAPLLARAAMLAAILAHPAAAQARANAPAAGSPLRAAILDALRPSVERRLRAPVTFADVRVREAGGWAYVRAMPYARSGTTPRLLVGERFDPFVHALLRSQAGTWRVVETAMEVPPAAAPYTPWSARHGAPAALFGRDADDAALEAAMREFIDAMAAGSPQRFLALLPRAARVRDINTITRELHASWFTRAQLANQFRRKDGAYFYWFGERDESGHKLEDYYAEQFQAAEGGSRRMWRRSDGTVYYHPRELRDGLRMGVTYVRWMKEGGRWVIAEMASPAS